MKILFDNVDVDSSSGPNSFGRKLIQEFTNRGLVAGTGVKSPTIQLSFIQMSGCHAPKIVLRLDGIYFNSKQDWERLNEPIKSAFSQADCVVYQTQFNKTLSEKFFGEHKKSFVISNGTSLSDIAKIAPINNSLLDKFDEIWCCSSSWRPHKRLKANIDYFHETKSKNSLLLVLGQNPDHAFNYDDVLYVGNHNWDTCISVYKRAKKFIHLAFLDHCPNVIVDARACGCEIVIASSGGTREIAGKDATVVKDIEWDMQPLDLYSPPALDFNTTFRNGLESTINIRDVASKYLECLSSL